MHICVTLAQKGQAVGTMSYRADESSVYVWQRRGVACVWSIIMTSVKVSAGVAHCHNFFLEQQWVG